MREWRLARAIEVAGVRATNARLVGMPHVAADAARGTRAGRALDVAAAASAILLRDRSPRARGRAFLLQGDTEHAIAQLREALAAGEGEALSDLGAALVAEAEALDAWEPALDAIVVTQQVIETTPELAPAHFNLALALEHIGLTTEARESFETAARLEPQTDWSAEALQRAKAIPIRQAANPWKVTERLLASSDPATHRALILADPHLARIHVEGPYLTDWASARIDDRLAEAHVVLERARSIASVLSDATGERLALTAIDAIDRAESNGNASAMALARAHLTYLEGRLARRNRGDARAIQLLTRAAEELASHQSPLTYVARYYVAGALYEQGRIDEALRVLSSLESEALDRRGYRGLATQLGWERGICLEVQGSYAEALDVFDRSRAMAMAIGERDLAARFDGLAAETLEYLGQSREAWLRRGRALRAYALTSHVDTRKAVALTSAAQLQIAARNWERARALLDYAVPLARDANDPLVMTQALAKRSIARDELHDAGGAARDRAAASLWARRLSGPDRQRVDAEIEIAEGVAKRVSSPRTAIAHFTRAIDVLASGGQSSLLPRLYLERARAHEAVNDRQRAREDLHAALEVVETWEHSIANIEQRAAMSLWSDAVRRDLIALELAARDVSSAFSYADNRYSAISFRAASRHAGPTRPALDNIQRELAQDAAILEFVTVRDRSIVFVVRADKARAIDLPGSRARVAALASALRTSDDATFAESAAKLYEILIAPIRNRLEGITTLVVVPSEELKAIPFGALHDRASGRYLLQDVTILHASTAAAAMTWSRQARERKGGAMVAVGSSAFDRSAHPEAEALPSVQKEASEIAELWKSQNVLAAQDATPTALLKALPTASAIHYAGHIVGRGTDARLLLAPQHGRDSLSAKEIADLSLTAQVVVLAGCRGSGMSASHAIIGDMASGFLAAGAPTVIASDTDIDDAEAPRTMRRLHSFLSEGFDAAEAVRRTALLDLQEKSNRVPLSIRLLVHGGSRSVLR